MKNDYYSMNIISEVVKISNEFEMCNSEIKRKYFIKNISLYNSVIENVVGNCGSFGTGYPFYALEKQLTGTLPIINEQILYNNQLSDAVKESDRTMWSCSVCLSQNAHIMPDLKQICKPCTTMDQELKPRKVLNRLPDIDMWMVCEDNLVDDAADHLIRLFNENNLTSSDIDPVQTIFDILEITKDLKKKTMPKKNLPLDTHIINYSTFSSLIEKVPLVLWQASINDEIPYLPIHPLSYRKKWQYDDAAYNFIHDYLSSLTEYDLNFDLKQKLSETRNIIANSYSTEKLYKYLIATGPDSVQRRHETPELKERFYERVKTWQK